MTKILGISAYYHDSSACYINSGEIINALQEERFSRKKNDSDFPVNSINYILEKNKITLSDFDYVCFYEKPLIKFERLLETYIANSPRGLKQFLVSMPIWIKEKLFLKNKITSELKKFDKKFNDSKLLFPEHHLSHASSAFFPSPFEEAIILNVDGVGEWATTTVAHGKGNNIKILKEIHFPHSLGLLYSAFTYFCGFKINSGEYKLMGLASYGKPIYKKKILDNLIDIKNDGSFRINQEYFNYSTGLTMTNQKFEKLFDHKVRKGEDEQITQFHMDLASSIQEVLNYVMIKITNNLFDEYKIPNLCLAGGVALNCVTNGKIYNEKKYKNIWIQPSAGDAGGSIGAGLICWYHKLKKTRDANPIDSMKGSFLGTEYSENEIEEVLIKNGAIYKKYSEEEIIDKTAEAISKGKAVGWFQGKMEFGPRALGSRSILADPRNEQMQKNLNLKVKFRESFRPFAPAILIEDVNEWFEMEYESPYMLFVDKIKPDKKVEIKKNEENLFGIDKLNIKRSIIPAVTHVDYSARIQTVDKKRNKKFYYLISKFKEKTSCPILINTSFNIRGEPIVCSPLDAFKCFLSTNIDTLIIENFYLEKSEN